MATPQAHRQASFPADDRSRRQQRAWFNNSVGTMRPPSQNTATKLSTPALCTLTPIEARRPAHALSWLFGRTRTTPVPLLVRTPLNLRDSTGLLEKKVDCSVPRSSPVALGAAPVNRVAGSHHASHSALTMA